MNGSRRSEVKHSRKLRSSFATIAARLAYAFAVVTIAWPAQAMAAVAAGGALPWDGPLTTLQNDLQGPVAHAITTAAVIGTGIMWSVSEHGTGVRKMSSLAFGGSCALGATQLMTTLFPLGGALF
jgi:type IV secretory pathway VirB2 component (pilin)